ncbi:hypothetical protein Tco_1263040 [Tanacetum coccineum]
MTNLTDMISKFVNSNTASTSGSRTLLVTPLLTDVDMKGILPPGSAVAYQGTHDSYYYPSLLIVQVQSQVPNSEPVVDPISALRPNPKPSIPYPSRRYRYRLPNDRFTLKDVLPYNILLKTGRALIDVYEGELTLRVGKEAITFNLDQNSRYSSNYDDMTGETEIDVSEMVFVECILKKVLVSRCDRKVAIVPLLTY